MATKLDNKLLIRLLMDHRATIDKTQIFMIGRINEQIDLLQNSTSNLRLREQGGEHYGAVRNWIQCKAVNGESVTWGSQDEVRLSYRLTVNLLEDLACTIASAAINEFKGLR
jgi:hypothetical protein